MLRTPLAFAGLLLLLAACGGRTVHDENVELREQLVELLTKITDKESAEKYNGDYKALCAEIVKVQIAADALEMSADKGEEAFFVQVRKDLAPLMDSAGKETKRIEADPELKAALGIM